MMHTPAAPIRLTRRYFLSAVLFIIGCILGPGAVIGVVFYEISHPPKRTLFAVPGSTTYHTDKAGAHLIWDQTDGGSSHAPLSTTISNIAVKITRSSDSQTIAVSEDRGGTERVGSIHRNSAFAFNAPTAGDYQIDVTGSFAPREFIVTPNTFAATFASIFGAICSGFIGFGFMVSAIILLILTIVRHARSHSSVFTSST